jgi:hypothetical protein
VDVRLNTTCHGLSFFAELSEHYRLAIPLCSIAGRLCGVKSQVFLYGRLPLSK